MPRRAVRQLQQDLTDPQQQQSQRLHTRRRLGNVNGSSSATNTTSAGDNVLLCFYRFFRSPILLLVLALFAAVMYSSYTTLMNKDILNDNVASIAATNEEPPNIHQSAISIVEQSDHELSIQQSTLDHLQTLSDFPKIVHLIWPDKTILSKNHFEILDHGAKNLQRLNPDWQFIVHDYQSIDATIKNFHHPDIPSTMNAELMQAHIVEKTDAFRLLKVYEMGGLYVDIDRVMNVNLNFVIDVKKVKLAVASHYDINFTNDLFGSSPKNKLILDAFKRQCIKREGYPRKNGWIKSSDQMELVKTYTASIEEDLFGQKIGSGNALWDEARHVLTSHSGGMTVTYKDVWCDGLLVNDFDGCKGISRSGLYQAYNVTAWNDEVNKMWEKDAES